MRPGGPASVANAAASTTQVQGQINMYQDPYAHSAMATRTLLAMDNAADPWNAAANPAAVEEKATQMKAYYREEMDEKLAKQKAFDERKSAEKSAEKSAPSEPARDLRYEDTGGDFNVFERLGGLFSAGLKKGDEERGRLCHTLWAGVIMPSLYYPHGSRDSIVLGLGLCKGCCALPFPQKVVQRYHTALCANLKP